MTRQKMARVLAVILLCFSAWQFSSAALIQGKAVLAQHLLQHAWSSTLARKQPVKPWPWADTWPVARIKVPRLSEEAIVLAGAKGNSLAFAPGHMSQTVSPGRHGVSIISAHRDTHFSFLEKIQVNDKVIVTDPNGMNHVYEVTQLQIVDERNFHISETISRQVLMLTTCYPFDAINPGGHLRYIVTTEALPRGEISGVRAL